VGNNDPTTGSESSQLFNLSQPKLQQKRDRVFLESVASRLLDHQRRLWTIKVSQPKSQERENVAREILAYFLRNPQCADDLHGITRWRLLDQMIHHALQDTRAALDLLVQQGYLTQESTTGSDPVFRLNTERKDAALSFVKDTKEDDEDE
jgi:hypothetical protein